MKTEWAHKKLIDLADYYNGMAFKPSDWVESGTKIIRIEQLNNPLGNYDYYQGSYPEINAIHNEDLIFSWSATLKVAIWKWGEGVLNQHLFKVVPFENVDKYFLYYLLDYNMPKLGESSHGSTMKHIKRKELETYSVKIPTTLPAQRRIAAILASADKVIAATQKTIAKYKQIKQGMMEDLLNEQCTMNNVQWVQKTLIELADYHNGMAFKPSDWANDGVKIIRIEQLNNPLGKYDYYQGMFPETSAIHNGDLIFSWSATLKVVIWQWGDGVLNQHLFKVVPASNVDKHFLYYLLDYNMPKLGESSHGSTMKHIKRKELETHTVYIPRKIAEQKRISEILSGIDAKIAAEGKVLQKYEKVKEGLMERLLNEQCTMNNEQ